MRGKVIATVGGVYKVQTDSAHCHSVKPLGVLKHRKIQIVVGDDAEIDLSDSTLTDIYPRKNLLIRPRIANIDLGIVVISADKPQFSSYLLDKFLTLLNFSGIRPLVVLSKSDLTNEETIGRIVGQYRKMGIEVLPYSRSDEAAFAEILRRIEGKTAAFMGQSGVGKSSLINRIDSGFPARSESIRDRLDGESIRPKKSFCFRTGTDSSAIRRAFPRWNCPFTRRIWRVFLLAPIGFIFRAGTTTVCIGTNRTVKSGRAFFKERRTRKTIAIT